MQFVKQRFTEDVSIDNNEFIDCEFENCRLIFGGGEFFFRRVTLINVRFEITRAVSEKLLFLRSSEDPDYEAFEQLFDDLPSISKFQPRKIH